ncbi:rRNA maturation RNase YbeY [Neomegalonema perideroedes]|uniref:rRNA maturation RNase YbeY n=1 Tax=Neomegalonema perideroedes TaxID=217219 RepID=UPI00035F8DCA|nr:rRNA maturation RNase YbeY [Neomegalonema perideroedes]
MIPEIEADVRIADPAWEAALPEAESLIARALAALFAEEEARAALKGAPAAELAILLTDDAEIAELNAQWRGKPKPTNVLSFPADSPSFGGTPPGAPRHLGDLALAFGVCAREAEEGAKPLADHLAHLIIHGALHLLGFDHERGDAQAEEMEAVEIAALARMGVVNPYAA